MDDAEGCESGGEDEVGAWENCDFPMSEFGSDFDGGKPYCPGFDPAEGIAPGPCLFKPGTFICNCARFC